MSMILHCGSHTATYEDVKNIPVPEHTDSWAPVPYADAIGYLREQADDVLKMPVKKECYGLNKTGQQLFAVLTLQADDPKLGLSIGLRQSYDKSIALGVVVGAQVFVCDNMCFSGSALKIVRKNTVNVWADFKELMNKQVHDSLGYFENMQEETKKLEGIKCPTRRGFAILGVARGEEVLTSTQFNTALGAWKNPPVEDFEPRTNWSLYNSITEGLKKGTPGNRIDRHVKAHEFITSLPEAN